MSEARIGTKLLIPILLPARFTMLLKALRLNLRNRCWLEPTCSRGKIMIGPMQGFLKAFADLGYTSSVFHLEFAKCNESSASDPRQSGRPFRCARLTTPSARRLVSYGTSDQRDR